MGKHSDFHLIFFQIVGAWRDFTVVTKLMKNVSSLYGFGGRCFKIRDVCMDFEPYFKVHNLVTVHPKNIILGRMINFDMIFHVVVSVYRLVKIWNSPRSPLNFGTASYVARVLFRPGVICGSSLLLVLAGSEGFSPGFLLPQKPTSPNSNSTRIEDMHENQLRLMWLPL